MPSGGPQGSFLFIFLSGLDKTLKIRILVIYSHYNKIPWTGKLEQQESVFSQFWKLDIQVQGTRRLKPILGLQRVTSLPCSYMTFSL